MVILPYTREEHNTPQQESFILSKYRTSKIIFMDNESIFIELIYFTEITYWLEKE